MAIVKKTPPKRGGSGVWARKAVMAALVALALAIGLCPGLAHAEGEARESDPGGREIPLNVAASGSLASADGWGTASCSYTVSLPKDGKLQIKFWYEKTLSDSGGEEWTLSLTDGSGREIWYDMLYEAFPAECVAGKSFVAYAGGLPKGTYRIGVWLSGQSIYSGFSNTYRITPSFTASKSWETEPNDTLAEADPLVSGKAVSGAVVQIERGELWDADVYRFTLPKAYKLAVRFWGDYRKTGSWKIDLVRENGKRWGKELWSGTYKATTKCSKTLYYKGLPAGTYYLVVDDADQAMGEALGVASLPYRIAATYGPDTTGITSAAASKGSLKVKWSKKKGASGYQVRYSTSKDMTDAKILTASKKASSKTLPKLQRNKKYYVQVRVVEKAAGKTYYSIWSTKKSATTR